MENGTLNGNTESEVGGNHTDHQHGEVLCAAVDLEALAVAAPCEGDTVHIYSESYGMLEVSPSVKPECGTAESIIYGVLKEAEKRGFKTGAFNAYVISNVIGGSGLSSVGRIDIYTPEGHAAALRGGTGSCTIEIVRLGW